MARVDVEYEVRVYATVDTDAREVTRVVVFDEDLRGPIECRTESGRKLAGAAARKALAVVDEVDWPAWEFGY